MLMAYITCYSFNLLFLGNFPNKPGLIGKNQNKTLNRDFPFELNPKQFRACTATQFNFAPHSHLARGDFSPFFRPSAAERLRFKPAHFAG